MTNVLECIDTNSDGRIDISGNVSITKTWHAHAMYDDFFQQQKLKMSLEKS